MEKVKTYWVGKYFDDHLERIIKHNLSLEDAKKLKNSLSAGCYVSYEIKEE